MISRIGIITMLLTLFFSGCSSIKPIVWTKPDVTFSDFKLFELKPVVNATGKDDKKEISSLLTTQFKEQFERQNLQLNDNPQIKNEVLVVESNLLSYGFRYISTTAIDATQRRHTRVTYLVLDTFLVNKLKGYNVAKITISNEVGYSKYTRDPVEWLLEDTVAAVTKEVVQIMLLKNQELDTSISQQ
jgi:hypothetical protein